MKSMLIDGWIRVQNSYWFVPSLMAAAAIVFALLLVLVDLRAGIHLQARFPRWFSDSAEGAQALLAAIAGSMITVAGVTFSLTLLAVSHATSQIGHGLLREFMRDRGNQVALGTFIATFLYCVVTLRSFGLDAGDTTTIEPSIPHLATLGAVLLAICSVMVLIYFIHHVTQSINISNVVSRLGDSLSDCVQRAYDARHDRDAVGGERQSGDEVSDGRSALPASFGEESEPVMEAQTSGYLRVIDLRSLVDFAAAEDLVVELECRPGDFVIPGQLLARVMAEDGINDEVHDMIRSCLSTGSDRTPEQDLLVVAEQLIEILGRSLSPGVNNQRTAILCIDQLRRALVQLLDSPKPRDAHYDDEGSLRVVSRPVTQQEFYRVVTNALRQYVRGDWWATRHFIAMLTGLYDAAPSSEWADRIAATLDVVRVEAETSSMSEQQIAEISGPPVTESSS